MATWVSDSGFTGGSVASYSSGLVKQAASNAAPVAVLANERYGMSSWAGTVSAGKITVRLHFIELYFTVVGARVFSVTVNGTLYLSNLDVLATTGEFGRELVRDIVINHPGGVLTIGFLASVDNSTISGMEIISGGGTVTTPIITTPISGRYSIQGTRIVDPNGNTFVPVGMNVNVMGNLDVWERPTAGLSDDFVEWGFNFVRFACGFSETGINGDLNGLIAEYTGAGIVVMIDLHWIVSGGWPSDSELNQMRTWWVDKANRFKNNPRVMFNIVNEPGNGVPAPARWRDLHMDIIGAIRATGARNVCVCDGTQWGQEAYDWNPASTIPTANSAILTYGSQIIAAYPDVMFSVHLYDQWAIGSGAQIDARLGNLVNRIQAAGMALMFGEVSGLFYFNTGNIDVISALQSAQRVAVPRNVGVCGWHGQGERNTDGGNLMSIGNGHIDAGDPSVSGNRSPFGQTMWEIAHR